MSQRAVNIIPDELLEEMRIIYGDSRKPGPVGILYEQSAKRAKRKRFTDAAAAAMLRGAKRGRTACKAAK